MSEEVRLLVGFSAGSASDFVARTISPALSVALNQPVKIERIQGESGAICAETLIRSAPDGRTLAVAIQGNTIGALLHAKKRYDPILDFAAVAMIATSPMVLAVSNTLGVSSVAELITLARSRPGQLIYAASAFGGAPHLGGVLFNDMAKTDMQLRVYEEMDAVWRNLEQGRAAATFNNIMSILPLARAGKLRMLAVTSPQRSAQAPEIPTVAETGLPGYEIINYLGIVAPRGTPAAIVNRINAATGRAVSDPPVRKALLVSGMEPVVAPPEFFANHLRKEVEHWRQFIQANPEVFANLK